MAATKRTLALDVGGANIKAAHSSGVARSMPFELWKQPDQLGGALARLAASMPAAEVLALTMTAELCDCYETKTAGVLAVLAAVEDAVPVAPPLVWGVDSQFHSPDEIRGRPMLAAAANWLALAQVAARLIPEGPGLLVDIGSTTADLIPTRDGYAVPEGRSDTERLQTGELVYAGVRRTPICALATELPHRGKPTGLAAELFATTLDIYLSLGDIPPDPLDDSTADGRPATVDDARDRLARMVGADREGFSLDEARALALAADEALLDRLEIAARRVCAAAGGPPSAVVVAGTGSFLAARLAARIVGAGSPIVRLDEAWGPVASGAACAHALVVLADELGR
jgi:probable H4MPT-linked C1 transfer pathway protein